MKRIVILGSTGSIGESALKVAALLPDRLKIVGLATGGNGDRVLEQAVQFKVDLVAVADRDAAAATAKKAPAGVNVLAGNDGVSALASLEEADMVLCAIVGMAGLQPVIAALENGKDVALATKEALVVAGNIVMNTAARNRCRILPVDSEHSAIFQCIDGKAPASIRRILLTASGGPFGNRPELDLDRVTVAETLDHPRWNMGRKVTVDSATLMNKGLEIMEAHWLFGIPLDAIDVVIHPESIIHSVVEFTDGGMLAQMGLPDMRFPIQYALTYPDRIETGLPRLDLTEIGTLGFRKPDESRFPCLRLAREAAAAGGTMPAVLNAANEVAVRNFLDGSIPFPGIWQLVEQVMKKHKPIPNPDLADILRADAWSRSVAGA